MQKLIQGLKLFKIKNLETKFYIQPINFLLINDILSSINFFFLFLLKVVLIILNYTNDMLVEIEKIWFPFNKILNLNLVNGEINIVRVSSLIKSDVAQFKINQI